MYILRWEQQLNYRIFNRKYIPNTVCSILYLEEVSPLTISSKRNGLVASHEVKTQTPDFNFESPNEVTRSNGDGKPCRYQKFVFQLIKSRPFIYLLGKRFLSVAAFSWRSKAEAVPAAAMPRPPQQLLRRTSTTPSSPTSRTR